MKFILLESRGGNYLVVAENVAWLRTAENGQTNVGIVGGQPLLVVGSVEEVAAKILAASSEGDTPGAEPAPESVGAEPLPPPEPVAAVPEAVPEPEPEPEPEPSPPPAPSGREEIATAPLRQAPAERPRSAKPQSLSLSDRLALAAAPRVKAGTQRFMGMSE